MLHLVTFVMVGIAQFILVVAALVLSFVAMIIPDEEPTSLEGRYEFGATREGV